MSFPIQPSAPNMTKRVLCLRRVVTVHKVDSVVGVSAVVGVVAVTTSTTKTFLAGTRAVSAIFSAACSTAVAAAANEPVNQGAVPTWNQPQPSHLKTPSMA